MSFWLGSGTGDGRTLEGVPVPSGSWLVLGELDAEVDQSLEDLWSPKRLSKVKELKERQNNTESNEENIIQNDNDKHNNNKENIHLDQLHMFQEDSRLKEAAKLDGAIHSAPALEGLRKRPPTSCSKPDSGNRSDKFHPPQVSVGEIEQPPPASPAVAQLRALTTSDLRLR